MAECNGYSMGLASQISPANVDKQRIRQVEDFGVRASETAGGAQLLPRGAATVLNVSRYDSRWARSPAAHCRKM